MPRVSAMPPESLMCIITIPMLGAQSWPTLRDPLDCSLPGSSVHGIFQATILEWFAISFIGWVSPNPPWLLPLPKSVWWLVDLMFLVRVVCQSLGYNCCCLLYLPAPPLSSFLVLPPTLLLPPPKSLMLRACDTASPGSLIAASP